MSVQAFAATSVFPVKELDKSTPCLFYGVPSGGGSTVDIEIVSLSLVRTSDPLTDLPPDGETARADSFFDVFIEVTADGGNTFVIDSFFDVFVELSIENKSGSANEPWQTEMLSMDLSAHSTPLPGNNTLDIRLSPTLRSYGGHGYEDQGGGNFQVDSFFDVFLEASVNGGTWTPADGAVNMSVVPEPATLSLLALGGVALIRRRK